MASENDPKVSLSANAAVTVVAKKSQSLIVILAITLAILSIIGCFLIFVNNPLYWVPFVFSIILLCGCIFLALLTHKNTDLAGAHATVIEAGGPSGFKIVTDPRVSVAAQSIAPLITILSSMHTLPAASGLVDENLKPIPNSEKEANLLVGNFNLEATKACEDVIEATTSLPNSSPQSEPIIQISEEDLRDLVPQEFAP